MNRGTLIGRGLRFYWRTHLGVVAGAAVASAVLVGALVVGDSVRHSLRTFALQRLGDTEFAVAAGDRFFLDTHAREPATGLSRRTRAAVLSLTGIAANEDGSARANRVQVLGVGERFWRLGLADELPPLAEPDSVALNERLAAHLGVVAGDTVRLRVEKPSVLPRDAPLSSDADTSASAWLTVRAVVADAAFGRFSLQANQIAPFNAFVPLAWLQQRVGLPGRCNVLLIGPEGDGPEPSFGGESPAGQVAWGLADAQLELRAVPGQGSWELRTDRIFLDPPAAQAAMKASPKAYGVLTYFVNELRLGERSTPYAIVAAVGQGGPPMLAPEGMRDDEILVNQWLADDLGAKVGDSVELTYFVVGAMRKLTEQTSRFRVRAILPIEGAAADRTLMPEFPGVADSENCRDWKPGIPIDLKRIRDKDEAYWDRYRGTPKAFVTLAAGQRMWGSRFGDLTAVRYPTSAGSRGELAAAIRRELDPAALGLFFRPVRAEALAASNEALDFGQLFIGLSFFLIVAALVLMALLFAFGVEQRAEEVGTLLAVGYRPRDVLGLLWLEGGALACVGALVGTVLGAVYTRLVLHGLSTVWSGAVAQTPVLHFHASPSSFARGAALSVVAASAAIGAVLLRQTRRPARALLAGEGAGGALAPGRSRVAFWLGLSAVAVAVALVAWAGASQDRRAAAVFFLAGALLLVGGLSLSRALLARLGRAGARRLTLGGLGTRNCARRRGRSLAVVGLLACGAFLVVAVGANRRDPSAEAERRDSGTGGFALLGESALPVLHDLDTEDGREAYGLEADEMRGVQVVALRVREGDDASCLNLNRAQRPRLLGVRPAELASRDAFVFAKRIGGECDPWELLTRQAGEGMVPCIGDEATVVWGLGKKVGETLDYTDERGRPFRLLLVGVLGNSILQGSLLIAQERFEQRFPSEAGYRQFLIDAPPARRAAVSKALSRALEDVGLELTPAATRLAALKRVENTYLSIFQALGGLGLVLGSVGVGVVVLRNVLERRGELALLRAVGFGRRALGRLVLLEHGVLVVWGLGCGAAAAVVAVAPALRTPGADMPVVSLPLTLLAVAASGLAWTWLAAAWALRSPLLSALRNE